MLWHDPKKTLDVQKPYSVAEFKQFCKKKDSYQLSQMLVVFATE